jgi:hypothetical protein
MRLAPLGFVLRITTLQSEDFVELSVERNSWNVLRTSARQALLGRIVRRMASTKGGRRRIRKQPTPNLLYVGAPVFLLALAIGGWALAIASPMFSAAVSAYLTQ